MSQRSLQFRSNRSTVILATAASLSLLLAVALLAGLKFNQRVHAASSAGESSASKQPVLVELFTSEGCSSCPPADALLTQLDATQNAPGATPVIVLSEHVTYWDQLGWHDPFSSESMTERQNQYGSRFGLSSVYTPQVVVDGTQEMVGSDRSKVVRAVLNASANPKIALTLTGVQWSGNAVTANVTASSEIPSAMLMAALADDSDRSSVLHGENGGRELRHVAVVRNLVEVHKFKGALNQQPVSVKLPSGVSPQPKMRLVVFLADAHSGHILGAAMQPVSR
jgi:hypothetical protein